MTDGWYFGVDSGGSKTEAMVGHVQDGRLVESAFVTVCDGSNPMEVGVERSAETVVRAVKSACETTGVAVEVLQGGCVAMAGGGRLGTRQAMGEAIRRHLPQVPVRLVHDGWAALAAGSDALVGIAVISGTGSLAFGRSRQGRTARAGGWGCWLDDAGSGYAIGQAALAAAARAYDGRARATALSRVLLERCHVGDWDELVQHIYQQQHPRRRIADLAPAVLQCAAANDWVSTRIAVHAAQDLAAMVIAVLRTLGASATEVPLVLAGGVLVHHPFLKEELIATLTQYGVAFADYRVARPPVTGAFHLAALCTEVSELAS